MERLKTPRGILKHPPLGALPVPITLDADANRGSIVRGEDGKLYASQVNNGVTYNWAPLTSDAFVDTAGSIATLTIWVKEGEPSPTDAEMLVTPPIIKENAVGTLDAAARFANIAALGSDTRVVVNIGAGLYNPASSWSNPTHFVAWDKNLVNKKHESVRVLETYPGGVLTLINESIDYLDLIATGERPGSNLALDGDDNHSFYPGAAHGYMDLSDYPHFIPFFYAQMSTSDSAGILTQFNQLQIRNNFAFQGGFHFIAYQDWLRLIAQFYAGLHPTRANLLDMASFDGLPEAAYSTAANNADIMFAAQRTAYSASATVTLGGLVENSLIRITAPGGSTVFLQDCSFGALPPTDLHKGGVMDGIVNIESPCFVNISNISLIGNTTVTSAGSGWTGITESGTPPIGTVAATAPFTYRRHSASFIKVLSAGATINLGADWRVRDFDGNLASNYYDTPSGQFCPNHWYALDDNGDIPSDDNSGPFLNCLIWAVNGLNMNPELGFSRNSRENLAHPGYIGDYLVNQGIVGRFGSNGFNSTLTRGVIFNTSQGSLNNSSESSFTFTIARGGPTGAWRKAGVPRSVINTGFNVANTSHTDPGEGSPTGNSIVVTTPDANGIRLATRTWNMGVDVALATIVRPSTSNGIYTL